MKKKQPEREGGFKQPVKKQDAVTVFYPPYHC
jgi:hypothetical protein